MNTQRQLLDGSMPLLAQLPGVANEAWRQFIHALTICDEDSPRRGLPRFFNDRTHAGALGCFALLPRRLADLGLMRGIRKDITSGKPIVIGDFILPLTEMKFLNAPLIQYNALLESLRRYDKILPAVPPVDMSRSGALALYHRLGPLALTKWERHKEPSTAALFARANKIF